MASRHARLAIYAMDPEGYKPEQKHAAARTTYMWQPSTAATIPTPSSPGTSNFATFPSIENRSLGTTAPDLRTTSAQKAKVRYCRVID